MFDNSGEKLQTIAKVLLWICVVSFVISGLAMIFSGANMNNSYYSRGEGTVFIVSGIATLILGPLFSWVGCLFIAAFGRLVENSENLYTIKSVLSQIADKRPETHSSRNREAPLNKNLERIEQTPNETAQDEMTTYTIENKEKRCNSCGQLQSMYLDRCINCKKKFI